MSRSEFQLIYDGSAVEDGTMDVRDLAPALLAVGNLFDSANKLLNGEESKAKVHIKTLQPGSFEVHLDVLLDFGSQILGMLNSSLVTGALNLVGLITSTILLIKFLKGKTPTSIEKKEGGRVTITLDSQSIDVDEITARVALDVNVRLAMERIIAEPLSKDGIDSVAFRQQGKAEVIEKSDGYAFLAPISRDKGEYEYRFRGVFSIVSLSFKEGNKWKLHDGKTQLNATVVDEDYIGKVNRGEVSFIKGDILICDVLVKAYQDVKGLKSEYYLERVIEQRHPEQQIPLF